ncbi:MAG TPA: hypothetical protein DEA22_01885 [Blastocatellia bacterium]|nr:hypothetical protein [Blastocatellia bacterium]
MNFLEGKSQAERNKIIAASLLGVLALIALYFAFGRGFFGGGSTAALPTTSPGPQRPAGGDRSAGRVPTTAAQNLEWISTPVEYRPGSFGSPDAGRNIFAFYEPPPPGSIPTQPTTFRTPEPTPTPPIFVAYVTPQNIYAGGRSFRLEINGEKFSRETRVYFSQTQLPTTFISEQRLAAEVPANMIMVEGSRQIYVQTADGKLFSNQLILNVQPPPKPQFQFVGAIARRLGNNDTAVFRDTEKRDEFSARLNDVVANRFRVLSISPEAVLLEDVNLGFRHRLELFRPAPGTFVIPPPVTAPQPGFIPGRGFDPSLIQRINRPSNAAPANAAPQDQKPDDDDEEPNDGSDKP